MQGVGQAVSGACNRLEAREDLMGFLIDDRELAGFIRTTQIVLKL